MDGGSLDFWLIKVAPISGATPPKAAKTTTTPKVAPEPERRHLGHAFGRDCARRLI